MFFVICQRSKAEDLSSPVHVHIDMLENFNWNFLITIYVFLIDLFKSIPVNSDVFLIYYILMYNQYENDSLDPAYFEGEELKMPFKQSDKERTSNQKSPFMDLLDSAVQPSDKYIYKSWQVFLLIQMILYGLAFFLCLICLNVKFVRRIVVRLEVNRFLDISFLLPSIIALHQYPALVRRYPYSYLIFCGSFYSQLYIILYLSIYFRSSRAEVYLLQLFIIHVMLYWRFHSVFQHFHTMLQLHQMDSKAQSEIQHQSEEESEEHEDLPNLFGVDQQPVVQPEEIQADSEEEEDQQEERKAPSIHPDEGDQEGLNDEQRSQLHSVKDVKQDFNVNEGEMNEEDDFIAKLHLEEFQEPYQPSESQLSEFNLEHYVLSRPILYPEDQFKLGNNKLFVLGLATIPPCLTLPLFDSYFFILILIPVILLLAIYICLLYVHLNVYHLQQRHYVLTYGPFNMYYLTQPYWLCDLLCPIVLYRASKELSSNDKKKIPSRMSLV